MKIRKILIEEFVRALVSGWVAVTFLYFFYWKGFLSRTAMWVITGVFMVIIFVSFTIMRVRTGHKLVLHGPLGCSLVAASIFVFNLIFMSVVLLLGEADIFFAHGIWPVIAWVMFPAILAWVSYLVGKKNHVVNQ